MLMLIRHSVRQFRAHPRLLTAAFLGVLVWLALPADLPWPTRIIVCLDIGGVTFLGLTWMMMAWATPASMLTRARLLDEEPVTILLLTIGAAIASLTAIGVELRGLKDLTPSARFWHVGLAGLTILCSWLVTHTIFALHYAHSFYGDSKRTAEQKSPQGGLAFPGDEPPDYWDFLYFSCVIGMTCQTSDVQICSHRMRRLSLSHGVITFFFNTVILALSINIAAGLL